MGFRLVPKSVTLNNLELRNRHYFAFYDRNQILFDHFGPITAEHYTVFC